MAIGPVSLKASLRDDDSFRALPAVGIFAASVFAVGGLARGPGMDLAAHSMCALSTYGALNPALAFGEMTVLAARHLRDEAASPLLTHNLHTATLTSVTLRTPQAT